MTPAPNTGWQPIAEWAGQYEVSESGLVRSATGREVKQWPNDKGYMLVRLSNPRKVMRVHRLVSAAFHANPDLLPEVNHKDGDKKNNQSGNLEWCTTKHNAIHSVANGLNKIAKFRVKEVVAIRREYATGVSCRALARKHNVDKKSMAALLSGKTYSWASPPPPETRT